MLSVVTATVSLTASCVNPEVKFRKGHLLDPLMDPAKDPGLSAATLGQPARLTEKGDSGSGASSSASCPTCGK